MNCGYPKRKRHRDSSQESQTQPGALGYRRKRQITPLLALARRDERCQREPALRQFIYSLHPPHGRSFRQWGRATEELLNRIALAPVNHTNPDAKRHLRVLYDALNARGQEEAQLPTFLEACQAALEAKGFRWPSTAESTAPRKPRNKKQPPRKSPPADYELPPGDRQLILILRRGLRAYDRVKASEPDTEHTSGIVVEHVRLPRKAHMPRVYMLISRALADVHWKSNWAHRDENHSERAFIYDGREFIVRVERSVDRVNLDILRIIRPK